MTDKKWLLVVIEQIISNSLKYTKEGGLEIYMDGQELCIKDTGIGIKNSDVLRVFERGFFRLQWSPNPAVIWTWTLPI